MNRVIKINNGKWIWNGGYNMIGKYGPKGLGYCKEDTIGGSSREICILVKIKVWKGKYEW